MQWQKKSSALCINTVRKGRCRNFRNMHCLDWKGRQRGRGNVEWNSELKYLRVGRADWLVQHQVRGAAFGMLPQALGGLGPALTAFLITLTAQYMCLEHDQKLGNCFLLPHLGNSSGARNTCLNIQGWGFKFREPQSQRTPEVLQLTKTTFHGQGASVRNEVARSSVTLGCHHLTFNSLYAKLHLLLVRESHGFTWIGSQSHGSNHMDWIMWLYLNCGTDSIREQRKRQECWFKTIKSHMFPIPFIQT